MNKIDKICDFLKIKRSDLFQLKTNIKSEFASKLKLLRESNNMTQHELAEKLKVSKSTVSMYELGNREPDFDTLEAIADVFNVCICELFGSKKPVKRIFTADDEALKLALFGDSENITDAQLNEVKQYAKFIRERDKK
jgi:transcriptional regulator with XRE-family HTH domain